MVPSYSPPCPPLSALSRSLALLAALVLLAAALPVAVALAQQAAETTAAQVPPLDQLPLAFVPNHGQIDPAVAMQVRGPQGTVSFLPHEVVFAVPQANETYVFSSLAATPRPPSAAWICCPAQSMTCVATIPTSGAPTSRRMAAS